MSETDSSPRPPSTPPLEPDAAAAAPSPENTLAPPGLEPGRGEMPFLDHLEELRWRILKALGAVLVGAIVCFAFSDPILKVLTRPYED